MIDGEKERNSSLI